MMKIENGTKVELQKVAGEVQAQQGGVVTLSEAVDFLITSYRVRKETVEDALSKFPIEMLDPLDSATEKALNSWFVDLRKAVGLPAKEA